MLQLIVPTDFSDTARNAVRYACRLAADLNACELILFHSFENAFSGSDGSPFTGQDEAGKEIARLALENLSQTYAGDVPLRFGYEVRKGSFLHEFQDFLRQHPDALIVMGLRDASRIEQFFMGSSTLRIAEQIDHPILIVPPDAVYKKIQTVIFSSDMRNVRETTPVQALRGFLRLFFPKLIVAYVDMDNQDADDFTQEKSELDILLEGFRPEYQVLRINDYATAIHDLAVNKQADVIVTVPRKHSFWERVFTSSHTSKLAYHTDIPMLTIHE